MCGTRDKQGVQYAISCCGELHGSFPALAAAVNIPFTRQAMRRLYKSPCFYDIFPVSFPDAVFCALRTAVSGSFWVK